MRRSKKINKSKYSKLKSIQRIVIPLILSLILISFSINYDLLDNGAIKKETAISNFGLNFLKYLFPQKQIFRAPLNVAPSFDPLSLPNINQLLEDTNYFFDVNATDPDGDPLIYSDDTNLFNIDPISGIINFTPTNAQIGGYTGDNAIALLVKDPSETGDVFFWGFTIISVNDRPILGDIGDKIIRANVRFSYIVNATDEEDDALGTKNGNLTFSDDTNLFDIDPITGFIEFTPSELQAGSYQVTITVTDTGGGTDFETITVQILPNLAPVFSVLPNLTAFEDVQYNSVIVATDPDNDPVMYSDNSSLFDVGIISGAIAFSPNITYIGNHTFSIFANDSFGAVTEQILVVKII